MQQIETCRKAMNLGGLEVDKVPYHLKNRCNSKLEICPATKANRPALGRPFCCDR